MDDIPADFRLLEALDAVMGGFAPVYYRLRGPDDMLLGFRVGPQHCNPRGHCHGGTWAAMADVLMGLNVSFQTGMTGPTISLSIDYLGAAETGQWVEGSANILRHTPRLAFAEARFTADGVLALRASAVFRRKFEADRTLESLRS